MEECFYQERKIYTQQKTEQRKKANLALETRFALSGVYCYVLDANITAKHGIEFIVSDDRGKEIELSPEVKIERLTELRESLQSESFSKNVSGLMPSIFLRMEGRVTETSIEKSIKEVRDSVVKSIEQQLAQLQKQLDKKKVKGSTYRSKYQSSSSSKSRFS